MRFPVFPVFSGGGNFSIYNMRWWAFVWVEISGLWWENWISGLCFIRGFVCLRIWYLRKYTIVEKRFANKDVHIF